MKSAKLDDLGASAGHGHVRSATESSRNIIHREDSITLYDKDLPKQSIHRLPDHNVIRIFPAPDRNSKPISSSRLHSAYVKSTCGSDVSQGSISLPSLSATSSGWKSTYLTASRVGRSTRRQIDTSSGHNSSAYNTLPSTDSVINQTIKSAPSARITTPNRSIMSNTQTDIEQKKNENKLVQQNRILFQRLLNIHSQSVSSAYTNPAPRPDSAMYRQKNYPWPTTSNISSRSGDFRNVSGAISNLTIPTITTTLEK